MTQTIFVKSLATLLAIICVLANLHLGTSYSWVGNYTLKDLESNDYNFAAEAASWTMSFCPYQQCPAYAYCSALPMMGGYQQSGAFAGEFYYQRVYTGLPIHNQINMKISFYPIDTWDPQDSFEVEFDGQRFPGWRPSINLDYQYNYCGNAQYPDYSPIFAEISVPHTGSTLTFRVYSKLDESADNESLGFRNITIEFSNTTTPSSSICGRVPYGSLSDKVCPCPKNTYIVRKDAGLCSPCASLCATCLGPSNVQCTSCSEGAIMSGTSCIDTPCHASCATCTGPLDSDCTSCPFDNVLFNGKCLCPMESYTYPNGSCLDSCGPGFSERIENDFKFCDQIDTNTTGCADTSLYKYQNDSCLPFCPYPFISVSQNGYNFCNVPCDSGSFFYQNGSCLPSCGFGYVSRVKDNITFCDKTPQVIPPCHILLDYQNLVTTNCSNGDNICAPGYFQYQNGSCIRYCNDPFYAILRNGSAYCYPPSSFPSNNNTNNMTCPDGMYLSGNTCLSCDASCETCNGPQGCLSCHSGYTLTNSSCVFTCPDGSYLFGDFCYNCDVGCATCNGPQECLSCQDGYILSNSSCIPLCPNGTYLSGDFCYNCTAPCETCTGPQAQECLSCQSGYTLINSSCISTCPDGTYLYGDFCYNCNVGCATCNGPQECLSCQDGYILSNSSCIPIICPNGTYLSGDFCYNCTEPCNTCTGPQQCLSCQNGYALINSSCISTCPDGTYLYGDFCYNCDVGCATCNGSQECLSCQDGYILSNSSCIPIICPNGTYLSGDFCYNCTAPCNTCNGPQECLSCQNGYMLSNSSCIAPCPDGTYLSGDFCYNCTAPCNTCTGPQAQECLSCQNGYILSNSSCIPICPNGTYLSGDTCLSCGVGCATCNGPQECLSCQNGYALLNSLCLSTCPSGMYLSGGTCLNCAAPCKTCNGPQECLSCQSGYTLLNSSCVSTCPTGFYADTSTPSCLSCPSACETCTSPIECQSCISGYVLSDGMCNNDTSTPNNSTYNNGCSGATFYKHQNGSCIATCPSPYVFLWKNNSAYCNSPCATGSYLSVNNTCITSCGPDETPRIQDYLMFCDKINNTNSTNSTNSPSVIVQIYIRYNISVVDFTSQDGLAKFVQQLATILGIDPSYIMIVSIREGSTIIESRISIASASDSESMDTAKQLAQTMGNKFSDAVANNNLNIINGVSVLDYKNSIQVVKDTTGGKQIQVTGNSSSSGAIIGLAAGLAAVGVVAITYAIYRYKKNSKLKAMRTKQDIGKAEVYKIEANVNQTNQEGKDDSLVRIKNKVSNRLEEVDIQVEGSDTSDKREQEKALEAQTKNVEFKSVRIQKRISRIEEYQREANVNQSGQVDQEIRDESIAKDEVNNEMQPEKQISNIEEIDICIEGQVDHQEKQDESNVHVDIFVSREEPDSQNITKQEQQDDDNETPMSLGAVLAQNL